MRGLHSRRALPTGTLGSERCKTESSGQTCYGCGSAHIKRTTSLVRTLHKRRLRRYAYFTVSHNYETRSVRWSCKVTVRRSDEPDDRMLKRLEASPDVKTSPGKVRVHFTDTELGEQIYQMEKHIRADSTYGRSCQRLEE